MLREDWVNGDALNLCQNVLLCLLLVTTEGLKSVRRYTFSPKYCVLTASVFTPEDVKSIHKQTEYGINSVLLTNLVTLQEENQVVKWNYFLSLLRETLSV